MKRPSPPPPELKRVTFRRDANRDGTIGGAFHLGGKRFRYTAMYLHGLQTMSVTEILVEAIPSKGVPYWRRIGAIHGSRMRLVLVRRLNEELQPGKKLYPLTQMPPARPRKVGG